MSPHTPTTLHPGAADWALYELQFVRREAQAEADLAFRSWSRQLGRDSYAVYRACQDRADAAQDELAAWVRGDPGRGEPELLDSAGTATAPGACARRGCDVARPVQPLTPEDASHDQTGDDTK